MADIMAVGIVQHKIASMFGVTRSAISLIGRRVNWAHVA